MFRKASCFVLVAITSLLMPASSALAAGGHDPSKIGDKLFNIVQPNAKSFWAIGLLVGAVVVIFGKPKPGLVVAIFVSLIVAGMIVYNPDGVGQMVNTMGNKVF